MHRLLTLSEQQRIQQPAANSSSLKSNTKGRDKNAALLDFGLIAWWTFEDGPTTASDIRVEDITGKRFKTLIQRGNNNLELTLAEADKKDSSVKVEDSLVKSNKNTNKKKKKKNELLLDSVEYEYSHYEITDQILDAISYLIASNKALSIDNNNGSPKSTIDRDLIDDVPIVTIENNEMDRKSKLKVLYGNLYEINRRILAAIDAVAWLDADSIPQKLPPKPANTQKKNTSTSHSSEGDSVHSAVSNASFSTDEKDDGGFPSNSSAVPAKSMLPLPSFRQRNQCPFEV